MAMITRSARNGDAAEITRIYNYYIANTCITFETDAVQVGEMAQRIGDTMAIPLPWLVAEIDETIVGYAYASKWKGRCAYRFAVESTIYLDPSRTGEGIGLEGG